MRRTAFFSASLAAMLALALPVTPVHAQTFPITFVSASGSDAGTCNDPATACRSFAFALSHTASGGELICLSGGNFQLGAGLTIAQSVTIDCGAAVGHMFGGLTINGAGIVVKLRNLTINDTEGTFLPIGRVGINAINMDALLIENCHILGHGVTDGIGINVAPSGSVSAKLHVSNSVLSGNGLAATGGGIVIQPSGSASVRGVIERTRLVKNTAGIVVDGTGSSARTVIEIDDSIVASNSANGITVNQAGMLVNRTSVQSNAGNGILAGPGAVIHLGSSTVATNSLGGLAFNGGQIFSYGDNKTKGNGVDNNPSGTLASN
jgi:hypothetical protein